MFKGISNIGQISLNEVLLTNVVSYFDWGFVNAGGFVNINRPTSGLYGGDHSILRPISDPRFVTGKVWEAKRNNWVWEQGTEINTPTAISGVYVNGTLQSSGFYYDYPNGRVIFNTAIATTSSVSLNYSYKSVKVIEAQKVPLLQRLQYDSFRVDDTNFAVGSGNNIGLADQRIQMPVVAVTHIGRNYKPYQIGDKSMWANSEFLFDILAEDERTAQKLADIISYQDSLTTYMFNPQAITSGNFPLDSRGALLNPSAVYPNLIRSSGNSGFRYEQAQFGKLRFTNARIQQGTWLNHELYHIPVRLSTEVVFGM